MDFLLWCDDIFFGTMDNSAAYTTSNYPEINIHVATSQYGSTINIDFVVSLANFNGPAKDWTNPKYPSLLFTLNISPDKGQPGPEAPIITL